MDRIKMEIEFVRGSAVATIIDNRSGHTKKFRSTHVCSEGLGGYSMADMVACRKEVKQLAEAYVKGMLQGEQHD